MELANKQVKSRKKARLITKKVLKKNRQLHLMLSIPVLLALVFHYLPLPGLVMAFQDYKPWLGIAGSKWVGLTNFKTLFTLPDSLEVIRNTLFLSVFRIVLVLVIPILFAILLNEIRIQGFKRSIQTLVYLPHFVSWVILSGIFVDLLGNDGSINQLLSNLGIDALPFLSNGNWFRGVLITTGVWKEFGFSAIVFLAALSGINPALYESAQMDGASRRQQIWHITLPGLMPTIVVVGILSLGSVFSGNFDQVYNMINPLVMDKGDVIDTFVYRVFQAGNFSFSTTLGLLRGGVGFLLIAISYWSAHKWAGYKIF